MPQVTVYIREEDIDKWKSLVKKSEFIHNALNSIPYSILETDEVSSNVRPDIKNIRLAEPKLAVKDLCKHGNMAGFCPECDFKEVLPKCCGLKNPCKHWQFIDGNWVNSISGEVREVV